jgi:hypothetical protein
MGRWTIVGAAGALLVVAGGAAAAVVLLTGDGPPTKAEYLARVNALCRTYNAKLADIPSPLGLANPELISQSIGRALPLVEERAEKVRALEAPDELRPTLSRLFDSSDIALDDLRRSKQAADDGDLRASATALGEFVAHSDEAHQIGLGLGFRC